jgi:alpha 1,2-mannosyltransferase
MTFHTFIRQKRFNVIFVLFLLLSLILLFKHSPVYTNRTPVVDLTQGYTFDQSATPFVGTRRENATILILARNSEAKALAETLRNFEQVFNHKFNYPYVMLSDEPFDRMFKDLVEPVVSSTIEYGLVPHDQWSIPTWLNTSKVFEQMSFMAEAGINYGASLSYRHMCRYNSGFFFRHPLVQKYTFYWRVEPGVQFLCDIQYDPFIYMADHGKKYSFVVSFDEALDTIPTLWPTVKRYVAQSGLDPSWLGFFQCLDGDYNLCHFWSNFEIGDLRFFRSPEYLDFFKFLDKDGGFYYERWGDAPVHSLAAALLLKKNEVHYFHDIGYFHNPYGHCPVENGEYPSRCGGCEGKVGIHKQMNCAARWLRYEPEKDETMIPDFFQRSGQLLSSNVPQYKHPPNSPFDLNKN